MSKLAVTSKVGKVKIYIGAAKAVALDPCLPTYLGETQIDFMRRKYKGRLDEIVNIEREEPEDDVESDVVYRSDPVPDSEAEEEKKDDDIEIDEESIEMYDLLQPKQIVESIEQATASELKIFKQKESARSKMRRTRRRTKIMSAIKKREGEV